MDFNQRRLRDWEGRRGCAGRGGGGGYHRPGLASHSSTHTEASACPSNAQAENACGFDFLYFTPTFNLSPEIGQSDPPRPPSPARPCASPRIALYRMHGTPLAMCTPAGMVACLVAGVRTDYPDSRIWKGMELGSTACARSVGGVSIVHDEATEGPGGAGDGGEAGCAPAGFRRRMGPGVCRGMMRTDRHDCTERIRCVA